MQSACEAECCTYVIVARLSDEAADCLEQLAVAVMGPATGLGDGLDGPGSRAPTLLGGLQQIVRG